jgi:hypothetical protein
MLPAFPDRSATLLWFPDGKTPSSDDFDPADPILRAEPYWFAHEAIIDAVNAVHCAGAAAGPAGSKPWLKYKDAILDEDEIRHEYKRLLEWIKSSKLLEK